MKRHDEGHRHIERIAAKFNVDPINFGRKRFCVLCNTWYVRLYVNFVVIFYLSSY